MGVRGRSPMVLTTDKGQERQLKLDKKIPSRVLALKTKSFTATSTGHSKCLKVILVANRIADHKKQPAGENQCRLKSQIRIRNKIKVKYEAFLLNQDVPA